MEIVLFLLCSYFGLLSYVLFATYKRRKTGVKWSAFLGKIIPIICSINNVLFLTIYSAPLPLSKTIVNIFVCAEVFVFIISFLTGIVLFTID